MNQPSLFELVGFGPEGWGKPLLFGTMMTILLAVVGFAVGSLIGVFAAWAKIGGRRPARVVAETYTTILRGVPDLLIIYLFYFGGSAAVTAIGKMFGAEGFLGFPGFLAGSLSIGVCCGAQQTEVFRGAFRAVHTGEIEAAKACGMSRMVRFRRIILPLTLRHALPGLGNVWQASLKQSALVSVVGMVELMRQTYVAAGSTGLPFDFYAIALCIYLVISMLSGGVLSRAERRFSRGVRRS